MGNLLGKSRFNSCFAQQCQRRSADYIGIDRFKASQYHQAAAPFPIPYRQLAAPFINAESAWYKSYKSATPRWVKVRTSSRFFITQEYPLVQYVNDTLHFIKSLVSTVLQICQYDAVLWEYQSFAGNAENTGCTRYNGRPVSVWVHFGHILREKHGVLSDNSHPGCFPAHFLH